MKNILQEITDIEEKKGKKVELIAELQELAYKHLTLDFASLEYFLKSKSLNQKLLVRVK